MIRETVVTTVAANGRVHIAPLGLIAADDDRWIIAPYAPSTTLDNLRAVPQAVANYVADVRIIAGCLTGRRHWPLLACSHVLPSRLAAALTHEELVVERVMTDAERPRFICRVVHRETHAAFEGFNRAQAAVVEAAILVSRLTLLPRARVEREMDHLRRAVAKTAGEAEHTAWDWLDQAVAAFYASSATAAAGAQAASQPGSSGPIAAAPIASA
jgi:hypothetical protein